MRTRDSLLGDLLTNGTSLRTGPFGTTLKASEYSEIGVPVVSVGEIGLGRLSVSSRTPRVGCSTVARLPEYVLRAGDIVFARKGSVDRTALVTPLEDGWFLGSDGLRLRPGESVDSRFLAFQLQDPWVQTWLLQHAGGSTLKSLNQGTISRIPIYLPPPRTQRAIAAVLGALDDKIEANSRINSIAQELADSLFASITVATRLETYSNVAEILGGGTPSTKVPEYWGGTIPWATPTDVTALAGPYLTATARKLTESGLANCASALQPEGSILMTSRATIGAFAISKVPTAVNQGFIVVRPHHPDHLLWLYHEMKSRVPDYIANANGATFLELSRGRFKAMELSWPVEESAMGQFVATVQPVHDRAYGALAESERLAELRDTLLPHLMSGQLSVRDAESRVEEVL